MTWLAIPLALLAALLLFLACMFTVAGMVDVVYQRLMVACFAAGVVLMFIAGRWSVGG